MAGPETQDGAPEVPANVGQLAEIYLGNILYALECTALGLEDESKPDEAAFYRGIGRALADAHGRQKMSPAS